VDKFWKKFGVAFLFVAIIIQLTPFYITLTTSVKAKIDLSSRWRIPSSIYWENFKVAIERGLILNAIKNSLIVTSVSVLFICIVGALAAYPLARNKSKLNMIILMITVVVMMVPPLSILVPLYAMMNKIGGVNEYWGLILLMITLQLPLSIFLYRNFITTVPVELEEAARIDGANNIQIFFKIIMPLLKPVTTSVIIITGTFIWNEYVLSLYMLPSRSMRTLTPTIASFFTAHSTNMGAASAASLMGMVPIVILYLFLQKYFIKGAVEGAIKG